MHRIWKAAIGCNKCQIKSRDFSFAPHCFVPITSCPKHSPFQSNSSWQGTLKCQCLIYSWYQAIKNIVHTHGHWMANKLANRFFTLLKGRFVTSWGAVGSDHREEIKVIAFQIINESVCNKWLYLVLNLKASISFCMHLFHIIFEMDNYWVVSFDQSLLNEETCHV